MSQKKSFYLNQKKKKKLFTIYIGKDMYFRSLSTLGFLKSEPKAYYNFVVLILKNRLRHLPFHLILTENSALSNKKKYAAGERRSPMEQFQLQ